MCLEMPRFVGYYFYKKTTLKNYLTQGFLPRLEMIGWKLLLRNSNYTSTNVAKRDQIDTLYIMINKNYSYLYGIPRVDCILNRLSSKFVRIFGPLWNYSNFSFEISANWNFSNIMKFQQLWNYSKLKFQQICCNFKVAVLL